jgi:hypothetical protein
MGWLLAIGEILLAVVKALHPANNQGLVFVGTFN